ncbi:uncharacterized protein EI90DRAFT_3133165 [Cantharellus anzutake]|uniref:uncharacterized protein n=1 Tax=Cantharellus anzutake TaxID=1750568 RepID=UPI001903DF2D|nr:uncharacterized protein EI90DRAFT_3133165 [Cantharellus anzutake]KAF8318557.1 hypothetical protein EI90DRAFT_3133165 [Cantharellus anzutake]
MCQSVNSVEYLGEEMTAALIGALFEQVYERLGHNPNDDLETQMCAWSYKSKIIEDEDLSEIDEWHKELYRHFCLEAMKNPAIDLQGLGHTTGSSLYLTSA